MDNTEQLLTEKKSVSEMGERSQSPAAKSAHAAKPSSYGMLSRGSPSPGRRPSDGEDGQKRYIGTRSGVKVSPEKGGLELYTSGLEDRGDFPTAELSGIPRRRAMDGVSSGDQDDQRTRHYSPFTATDRKYRGELRVLS